MTIGLKLTTTLVVLLSMYALYRGIANDDSEALIIGLMLLGWTLIKLTLFFPSKEQ